MIKRIALLTLLVTPLWLSAQVRTEKLLEKGWKFTREDNPEFKTSQFDDTKWQSVCIPHDWAIYGPFSINNDKQNTAGTGFDSMSPNIQTEKNVHWYSMEP